jgi:hypothetical protein
LTHFTLNISGASSPSTCQGFDESTSLSARTPAARPHFLRPLNWRSTLLPLYCLFSISGEIFPLFFAANQTAEQFKALFSDFFYNFDTEIPVEIRVQDSAHRTATLRLVFDLSRAVTTQSTIPGFQVRPQVPSTIVPLAFERFDFQGQKSVLVATINQTGQPFLQPGKQMGLASGFISSAYFGSQENATWLSQLSVAKRSEEVIESLRRHFPFIRAITSETVTPGTPATIYADVSNLPRKVPLSLVSGGISRLFTLMLAIVANKGGVVLVDEIENGMFHDQYESVWKTLAELSERHQTQLFISSHSKECLKDAVATIALSPAHFALLRARRQEDETSIELFEGEQMEAALEKNGEVRD